MTTTETLYQHYLQHNIISTDTRNITPGCIFFALKGDLFNANEFAAQAIGKGAAYAVIDEEKYAQNDKFLLVGDVLSTLQDLARHHRKQLNIPVIGLTGSNGKTTSKELVNAVLAERYKTFATFGNLNNHIGVPLSILSITNEVQIAVIEMGANHQKEIELLCTIAQPTHGIITNVGMAHLDGFGGFEGVKKGKAELYAYLKQTNGYTFINRDNPNLLEMSTAAGLNKLIYYGTENGNAIKGTLKSSDPFIEVNWTNHEVSSSVKTHLTGSYNFENILAAICIGDFFDMSPEEINTGLSNYQPKNNRSQLTKTEKNTVICDFYNANPSSMAAALKNIAVLSADKKTAILGDMFELGPESLGQHELIVKQANESGLDQLIFIGKDFYLFKDDFNGIFFETPAEAATYLQENQVHDHLVLLKGSRGMKLESLLQYL
ncbi:UDP-N-acetylmuramoyl-tripeptide--D-alanyl-D-alanine ligase [Pedobacter zeae]|uniref:UDP-N-acetylmuramoyl-tripeptide--D-alanyl-D-alanine ligase n=1 Tax=Pedobacter zeae TaxID=1737356 RepID=A0A7W6KD94_9SPHI|nr:UDP-N-acetylmuramoyl-tripeptide--D-alanyl-D-alanine ligase [Pedobacter zeae]MBB4109604.1 UDP-N-acetylmuramoyl-tripeptide--D-alanyl-D-alanine ligase [Pedobacter zeae]GGH13177.1 UDP-N-acetylmuramoyl-tripeptide--D-alanyl-D-alanine ligase [Pedobacter zeae]